MAKVIRPVDDIWQREKQKIWDVLGGESISRIPVQMWERHMMLMGVSNEWWSTKTGMFPARSKSGGHPLFVLGRSTTGFRVCPCSSKGTRGKFIRKGCTLQKTGKVTDRNSYVLERFAFNIPKMMRFKKTPSLAGVVPELCLAGGKQ